MKPAIAVPAIFLLIYRAYSRRSLTPAGLAAAFLTAALHALHPSAVPFTLLGAFFLAGTAVTKVKHATKARLTQSSSGGGGEGPRTHVQVLANSAVATVLTLAHAYAVAGAGAGGAGREKEEQESGAYCFRGRGRAADVLLVGVVANYAAVAADTFSSELGILARSAPRLVTAPWRAVPRGTNGGVTAEGLLAGLGGGAAMAAVAWLVMPFCGRGKEAGGVKRWVPGLGAVEEHAWWDWKGQAAFAAAMALAGLAGSVLDSVLGAVLQASVVDVRSGKVVEGSGGVKVLVHAKTTATSGGQATQRRGADAIADSTARGHESRRIDTGRDVLDNNAVNLVMAASTSLLAMLGACIVWEIAPTAVLRSLIA